MKLFPETRQATRRSVVSLVMAAALLGGTGLAYAQLEKIPGRPMAPVTLEQGSVDLFDFRVLTTGLENPWSVAWGPDDFLWVTERTGMRVTRVDPVTGVKQSPLVLENVVVGPQQGLLGLVLHPELLKGADNDHVFISHTYDAAGGQGDIDRKGKIVRYTYDEASQQLVDPVEIVTGIPAGTDHNSGRMTFGPDGKLYYAAGDQGHNQFRAYQLPIEAQRLPTAQEVADEAWTAYTGKVLRINLDGSIPDDNPEIEGVRSHVFTYGHRNPQGIAFSSSGALYSVEHGPSSDDELNLLTAGGNYGWPNVSGFRDDAAYSYVNWSQAPADLKWEINPAKTPAEVQREAESGFAPDIVEPLASYWVVGDGFPFNEQCGIVCDPTIAPSSIRHYEAGDDGIAEWDNSILMTTLKHGTIYVQALSEDGQSAEGPPVEWLTTQNRYRDVVLGPDNRTVFVLTDNSGAVTPQYGDQLSTNVQHNPGAILMFTFKAAE